MVEDFDSQLAELGDQCGRAESLVAGLAGRDLGASLVMVLAGVAEFPLIKPVLVDTLVQHSEPVHSVPVVLQLVRKESRFLGAVQAMVNHYEPLDQP